MRIVTRSVSRAAASSMVLAAALALVGLQATAQTASAATGKAPSVVTCTTANTKLTVTEVSRPVNHLLLKATNTGSKPCYAYIAPFLRAGADAQAPVAWAEETTPRRTVRMAATRPLWLSEMTSWTFSTPRARSERRNFVQNGFDSLSPTSPTLGLAAQSKGDLFAML